MRPSACSFVIGADAWRKVGVGSAPPLGERFWASTSFKSLAIFLWPVGEKVKVAGDCELVLIDGDFTSLVRAFGLHRRSPLTWEEGYLKLGDLSFQIPTSAPRELKV